MTTTQSRANAEYILRLMLADHGIPVDPDKLTRAVDRLAPDLMRHVESCSPGPRVPDHECPPVMLGQGDYKVIWPRSEHPT